ncbi:hypothetical protein [Pseudonocardia sp.]|uniref:hypothetical protein n=1 Tax=Pseudonocardia sp. TaxID=60912 RepID=UPI00261BD1E2|nr:hypothetical protein [Pseudonocardia sp.]
MINSRTRRVVWAVPVVCALLLCLPGAAAADAVQDRVFDTRGDNVHLSRTPPPTASGHGWWLRGSSDAELADVTVQLQVLNNGNWVDVGPPGRKRVKPGGGSANRANARYLCANSLQVNWRSVIDVDLVGYADSSNVAVTPPRLLSCGA